MASFLDRITNMATSNAESTIESTLEHAAVPHKSLFPELALYTRIKLFIAFLITSLVLMVIAFSLIIISLRTFAALYTFSTILLLFSIMFLVGPMEQVKAAVKPGRIIATILLLLCIVLTLLSALKFHITILAMIFAAGQFAAFIWYALSYIPYARTIMKHFCSATCSCCSV